MTTQLNARLFALRAVKAGLGVLLISALLTSARVLPAAAQSAHIPEAPAGDATVSELAQMLAAPINAQRKHALQRVTDLAYRSPEVDLTPTVPALVGIYRNDPDERYRLAAVSALHAIGDEHGMEQVRKRVLREPSLRVQYVALNALLDHYGPQAFGRDVEAVTLAKNVIARKQEAGRLAQNRQDAPVVAEKN